MRQRVLHWVTAVILIFALLYGVSTRALWMVVATIPVGRLGRPAEIAKAVLYLVDDENGFMTGSTLSVNGGQHMY